MLFTEVHINILKDKLQANFKIAQSIEAQSVIWKIQSKLSSN